MRILRSFRAKVGEQVTSLLRNVGFSNWKWWAKGWSDPDVVDYTLARQLYKNSNESYSLGAGFCRRIIDGCLEFMGKPTASSDDEDLDDWLNDSINEWWSDEITQILRNATRDSKTVVRLAPYDFLRDPLISASDNDRVKIEVIDPERVRCYYDPFNAEIMEEARITHHVPMQTVDDEDRRPGDDPTVDIHEVIEVIDREQIRYWDQETDDWIDNLTQRNTWGVVPVLEIYNEWDETAGRGQSDLEAVFPFISAFHDVMLQSLQAHAYHSIPKVKFNIDDIDTFLRNNFPDAYDAEGKFTGKVPWKGKEIIFLGSEEDAGFVEATSILGDSKTLLEFLFDCICIASETPGWVLLRTEQGAAGSDPGDAISWVRRIERKRNNFRMYFIKMFKIALLLSGRRPVHVKLAWDHVRPEDETDFAQAFEQITMGLEVAAQRKIISDKTYRAALRRFLPMMKNPAQEARDAEDNEPLPELAAMNGNGNIPTTVRPEAGGANE